MRRVWSSFTVVGALSFSGCGRVGYGVFDHGGGPSGDGGERPSDGGTAGAGSGGGGATSEGGSSAGGAASGGTGAGGTASGGAASGGMDAGSAGGAGSGGQRDAGMGGTDAATPVDAGCTLAPTPIADPCTSLPELPAAPVIDGELDCGLELRPMTGVGWNGTGTPDSTAAYAVAWGPAGVYFYVRVYDPAVIPAEPAAPTWYGDGVELYLDADGTYVAAPSYDGPGTRQFIVAAPPSATPTSRGEYYLGSGAFGAAFSTNIVSVLTTDGYAVEAYLGPTELGVPTFSPAANGTVGFDLGVNLSYPTAAETGGAGHRIGQFFYRVDASALGQPFNSVAAFCDPTLVPR